MPVNVRSTSTLELRIPGLDPGVPYTSRLSARSALYTDLRLLLEGRDDPLPSRNYRALVVEQNCLGRRSTSARAKIWQELRARYRLDRDDPLFAAFWREWRRCQTEAEHGLTAYTLFASNDRLVTDLGIHWLFPKLRKAAAEITPAGVQTFMKAAAREHPEVESWSDATITAVARKYCASIRDFGLAKGGTRKMSTRPALYGAPTRLLIRALRLGGVRLLEIVQSPAFRLLGIDAHEVIDALSELNRREDLRFRMQGDVVELYLPEVA